MRTNKSDRKFNIATKGMLAKPGEFRFAVIDNNSPDLLPLVVTRSQVQEHKDAAETRLSSFFNPNHFNLERHLSDLQTFKLNKYD